MEIDKTLLKQIVKEKGLKTIEDVEDFVKELVGPTIQALLEAEMENQLGYSKYDYKNKQTDNSRNGSTKKTVRTSHGEIDLQIPRDRNGEFDPIVVKKHQKNVTSIEDRIISMYARGMTVRDIQKHLNDIYGIDASPTLISNITDKILPLITEWQNRPLLPVYALVFLDAIHYKVRHNSQIVGKAAYMVVGIDLDGRKDVLGMWVGEAESATFWLNVLTELQNRGVKDILVMSVDNLTGISQAISACFPQTEIQKCVVHQIRNSFKYVPRKHVTEFMNDLKPVYQAPSEKEGLRYLDLLEEKWGTKYVLAVKPWRANWDELATFFDYPAELRKIMYTTNIIESYHRQLRKVTKAKSIFPNDEALLKILYLITIDVTEKWTKRVPEWQSIITKLAIRFGERVSKNLS
ncbi:MAG: IS256 family transposase [Firmicutes bacterium]|nr:IS256 family transposase [Bacillota bacterium]